MAPGRFEMAPARQSRDFKKVYSEMSTEELLRLEGQKNTLTDQALTALEAEMAERRLGEPSPASQETEQAASKRPTRRGRSLLSYLYRLGLFFLAAIASGFTATAVFPMPYKAQEAVGRMTVDAALAWFFLSVVIQGKWLTFRRSLYLAVALYCAFLIFVFAQLLVGAPQH